jgi:hypothetical protein
MRGLVGSFTLFMSMCQSCVMRWRESDVLKRKVKDSQIYIVRIGVQIVLS